MDQPAVIIRHTTRDDADALRTLRLEALQDSPLSYGTTYEEAAAWSIDEWNDMADAETTFVAERDGVLVGMARGGRNDREDETTLHRWLWGMYVTPSARGDGTAGALVDAVAEWSRADGGTSLHLFVSTQAPRAKAFYERLGFRDDGDVVTHEDHPELQFQPMGLVL